MAKITIIDAIKRMRDDLKVWCANNFNSLKDIIGDGDTDTLISAKQYTDTLEQSLNDGRFTVKAALMAQAADEAQLAITAWKDGNGNPIADTYATKEEVDAKQPTITGGASTITTSNLAANRALVSSSSGKVMVSAVTSTELGYLDGVTSNIQTQLNDKFDDKTADELRTYIDAAGKNVEGEKFNLSNGATVTAAYGAEIFNAYNDNQAIGAYSHAEGYITTAQGTASHAEGRETVARGNNSHAEGYLCFTENTAAHAEGYYTHAEGAYSHAEGHGTTASGECSHAEGYHTTALAYQHAQGHYNKTFTATAGNSSGTSGTAFIIGNGYPVDAMTTSTSNAFRVDYDGKVYAASSTINTGADYAEFFEWKDSNPDSQDRRGYFVTLDGEQIKIAKPEDYVLGIVSGLPAIIGNGDEDWRGRYVLDDFGAYIVEEFEYEENTIDKETGETKTVTKTGTRYKENPDYDPSIPYVQREDRPEWDAVGMLGVLSVRDDGTCKVNGYCKVGEGGIATISETGYRVIKRVNDNIVKVIFR